MQLFLLSLSANNYINNKTLDTLSKDKTWLKLLHYKNNNKSDLLSKNFFLSKNGHLEAKEELKYTINAYNDFINYKKDDSHPQCKFPARYFWLSSKINLPKYKKISSFCKNLSKWNFLKKTDSISIILVSGYLGNPASTFGHSFIKLNTENNKNIDLFDLSINYGALVPDKEPTIKYIFKGIFGGYQAGFSDKYFYTQDLTYSHNEFRDMWDYKLNLTKKQKDLLILHFWEIIGKKFKYYFLNKNCAYKVSEVLELIMDKPIIQNSNNWYAPVETFNRLEELNIDNNIIDSIKYVPSSQRKVYERYSNLSSKERITTINIINNSFKNLDNQLELLKIPQQINITNFLLEYQKYLLIKYPKSTRIKEVKNILLLKRLMLPPKILPDLNIKKLDSPAKGNKPMIIKTGISNIKNKGFYNTLGFNIFAIESLGKHSLGFDELIVSNINLGIKINNEDVFLDTFDLIKIKKLKYNNLDWDEDLNLSWNLNIGSKLIYDKSLLKNSNDNFIEAGVGKVLYVKDNIISYLMINSSIHDKNSFITINPNINLDFKINKLKTSISLGQDFKIKNSEDNLLFKTTSQYKINHDFDIEIGYKKDTYSKSFINIKWFF